MKCFAVSWKKYIKQQTHLPYYRCLMGWIYGKQGAVISAVTEHNCKQLEQRRVWWVVMSNASVICGQIEALPQLLNIGGLLPE